MALHDPCAVGIDPPLVDLLAHLRTFVVVAEELHFGRAAARLHLSQPPLSRRIRALERRVDGPLFARTSRRVELTALGRRLLPDARALVEQAERLERRLDQLGEASRVDLVVAVPASTPAPVLGALLQRAGGLAEDVAIDVVHDTPAGHEALLGAERAHIAVLAPPPPPFAVGGGVLERPLGVLLPASAPAVVRPDVEPAELADAVVVTAPRDAAPAEYDRLLAELAALGWAPREVRHAEGPAAAAGHVLADGAAALVVEPSEVPAGLVWRPLADGTLVARACVCVRRSAGPVERALAGELERLLAEHDGWRRRDPADPGVARSRPSSGLPW